MTRRPFDSRVFARGLRAACLAGALGLLALPAPAQDWPMWGGDPSRNMASPARELPVTFNPGTYQGDTDQIDLATTQGVKWVAKLGSQAYGTPVVAAGRIYVGTNNEAPRDPRITGDHGILMCLDQASGKLLWQFAVPKLGAGKVSDWEYLGICSSPAVDGDRVYVVTNRCEVVCLDVGGLANGNQGMTAEAAYYGVDVGELDADILWKFDMREEVGVFPHNITSSSPLVIGDRVYATTSNGQDWSHVNIPSPFAPVLIALDKATGKLVGEEGSGISQRLFHCNWSSPAYTTVGDQALLLFGAGDGFLYGFDPVTRQNAEGYDVFPELFRCDANPPAYKVDENGQKRKYPSAQGYSEVIGTPVVYKDRAYISVGQDPEHGDGVGALSCVDLSKRGDSSASGLVWRYTAISRALSTVAIADGILYAADYAGVLHCLNPDNGEVYWTHDTGSHVWGSPLVADGKIYLGNEDGEMVILAAGKEKKILQEKIAFTAPLYASPIAVNGTLYVTTMTHLYAIDGK